MFWLSACVQQRYVTCFQFVFYLFDKLGHLVVVVQFFFVRFGKGLIIRLVLMKGTA